MSDLLAHGRTRLVHGAHDGAGERIFRDARNRRRSAPDDAERRDLISRTVEAALVDRVADLDVRIAVAVRAHVARGGEARAQVGLRILHGDQQRLLRRSSSRHAG